LFTRFNWNRLNPVNREAKGTTMNQVNNNHRECEGDQTQAPQVAHSAPRTHPRHPRHTQGCPRLPKATQGHTGTPQRVKEKQVNKENP